MTDEIMRELVTKHDAVIGNLVTSVEHLVSSQTETNKRLEEISKFLAKQAVFSNKLEMMDKDLIESFKRVHSRIDEIDAIQKSESGCNSMKLLNKDLDSVAKDTTRLIGIVEEHRIEIENISKVQATYPSTNAIRWGIGLLLVYTITFGTYVVQSLNSLTTTDARITTLLERNIVDTGKLMEGRDEQRSYKNNR